MLPRMSLDARTAEISARRDHRRQGAAFREWAIVALAGAATLVAALVAALA